MKAKEFEECNATFAKDWEHGPIPCYMDNSPNGDKPVVISYGLNFWERIMVVLTGRIWISITTFDGVLRPLVLTTLKRDLLTTRKQRRDREKKGGVLSVVK